MSEWYPHRNYHIYIPYYRYHKVYQTTEACGIPAFGLVEHSFECSNSSSFGCDSASYLSSATYIGTVTTKVTTSYPDTVATSNCCRSSHISSSFAVSSSMFSLLFFFKTIAVFTCLTASTVDYSARPLNICLNPSNTVTRYSAVGLSFGIFSRHCLTKLAKG